MSLTKPQLNMHWSLWKRVTAVRPDLDRHELYIEALGEEKSLTAFNNDDLDKVKAAMLAIVEPGNLDAQLHALNGQRDRLLAGIRRSAPEYYVAGIVERMNREGKLGSDDLDQLGPQELVKVRIALKENERRIEEQIVAQAVLLRIAQMTGAILWFFPPNSRPGGSVPADTSNPRNSANLESCPNARTSPSDNVVADEEDPF